MPEHLPPEPQSVDRPIKFISPDQPLTIEIIPRHLKVIQISEDHIDLLTSSGADVNLAFFGISFGALVAFWVVLDVGGVTDPVKHGTYLMLTLASGLLSAYFGIQAAIGKWRLIKRIRDVKKGKALN